MTHVASTPVTVLRPAYSRSPSSSCQMMFGSSRQLIFLHPVYSDQSSLSPAVVPHPPKRFRPRRPTPSSQIARRRFVLAPQPGSNLPRPRRHQYRRHPQRPQGTKQRPIIRHHLRRPTLTWTNRLPLHMSPHHNIRGHIIQQHRHLRPQRNIRMVRHVLEMNDLPRLVKKRERPRLPRINTHHQIHACPLDACTDSAACRRANRLSLMSQPDRPELSRCLHESFIRFAINELLIPSMRASSSSSVSPSYSVVFMGSFPFPIYGVA